MPKPTVCFVFDAMLDLFSGEDGPRFGGSQAQLYLVAKHLAEQGEFNVRIVGRRDPAGIEYPGISFRQVVPPVRRGVPYLSRFVNRERRRRPFADIEGGILFQTILSSETVETAALAREFGHKFVFRVSSDAEIEASIYPPEEAEWLQRALKSADGVVALTRAQQRALLAELAVDSSLIPNIVEVPPELPEAGGGYVLWAGRAAEIKRPWIMVETARVLPDIEFVMLMAPGDSIPERLFWQSITKEAARVPNLTIVPGVRYSEMVHHYRDAAIVVNTSAAEGFSNVFLQAAAQCTPIISLDADPDGMLELEGCGHCLHGDISAFRSMVVTYMSDPRLIHERGSVGYEYVRRHHSPEAVMPVLSDFLRGVLAK